MTKKDSLKLGKYEFSSRFILGSGKFSLDLIKAAVEQAGAQILTLALRRVNAGGVENILDSKYLLPDNFETIKAVEMLAKEGFTPLPYMYPDLYAARLMRDVGAAAIMPLAAPIGSNKGLQTRDFIQILLDELDLPIIVDAGLGTPAQACEAMQMGVSAVMINTAIANAGDISSMARAFSLAVEAGRMAFLAKLAPQAEFSQASSPLTGFLRD